MEFEIILKVMSGLVMLTLGGEFLVRGASKIAKAAGVSSLVIGLTIVAFGTSAPELAVSLKAGLAGNSNIAIANVVGSNIFNVLFILGICAFISPLNVSYQLIRLDIPLMIFSSFLVLFFGLNGKIGALEGIILFSMVIGYTFSLIKKSKKESKEIKKEYELHYGKKEKIGIKGIIISLAQIFLGLGVLVLGGGWLVSGAVSMAKNFGVSDTVIGLTIVAIGTSLPEVATSVIATYKGERDIAIGNIIGSNIFNLLSILGISSIFSPGGLTVSHEILAFDFPVMIGTAVLTFPIFFTGFTISKWEGALFLITYILYTVYLILKASNHLLLTKFEWGLLYIALPIFIFSLIFILVKTYKQIKRV